MNTILGNTIALEMNTILGNTILGNTIALEMNTTLRNTIVPEVNTVLKKYDSLCEYDSLEDECNAINP